VKKITLLLKTIFVDVISVQNTPRLTRRGRHGRRGNYVVDAVEATPG